MNRRNLLKGLGLGLSAGVLMPELLISCKKSDPGPEVRYAGTVAVIGAGASGLYVADILRSKGINVTIFEADSRIGGRVKSYRPPKVTDDVTDAFYFIKTTTTIDGVVTPISIASGADFPVELGPEFVTGSDSVWNKIINDLTLKSYDISQSINEFILDNQAKTGADSSGDADYNAVISFVNNLPQYTGTGVTVSDAAGVSTRGADLLNAMAGNNYGTSSDRLDAGALGAALKAAALTHDQKIMILKAVLFNDVLNTRFSNVTSKIKFNTQVSSIDYSGTQITISDKSGGNTTVDKVVVTVPVSVLQNGSLSFNPPLPSAMASSFAKFKMDSCIRVILDFKKNFWGDADTGIIFGGDTVPQYFSAGVGRSATFTTLTLTISGQRAATLSAMGKDMITPILAEMDTIWDGAASKNIRRNVDDLTQIYYTIQDWSKEPFILGGASYPTPGATNDDRVALTQPIGGKLFFAGEVTDITGNGGTLNGALSSAERAAKDVVVSITG